MKRSVERLETVERIHVDLATGKVSVQFHPGPAPTPAQLRQAVIDGGFTPVSVSLRGLSGSNPTTPDPVEEQGS